MDKFGVAENEYVEFTANYCAWPFNDFTYPGHPDHGYEKKIPSQLEEKLLAWARDFAENFDEETGLFPSQEHRARFDRDFIALANELASLGIRVRLNLWW